MRFSNGTILICWLLAWSVAPWAFAQTARYPEFTGPQSESTRKADSIRILGEQSVRDLSKLAENLPILVGALHDESKEVRFAAARAIGNSAIKWDRFRFTSRSTLGWEELSPLYRQASSRLEAIGTYQRIQRQIDSFIDRNERLHLAGSPIPPSSSSPRNRAAISKAAQQFLDEFFRFEEDQLVEMWRFANQQLPTLHVQDRQRVLDELLVSAPPRWFEFMIMLSDRYDDEIITAALVQGKNGFNSDQAFFLSIATPQGESVRRMLASVACDASRIEDDRLLALSSLALSPYCEPQIVSQVVRFSLQQPSPTRVSELYAFLTKNQARVSEQDRLAMKRYGLAMLENDAEDASRLGELVHAISEFLPGDPDVLKAIGQLLSNASVDRESLLAEALSACSYHGEACSQIAPRLISLVSNNDSGIRELSLAALKDVQGLSERDIALLVSLISDKRQTSEAKLHAARVLKSNPELACERLREALVRDLRAEPDQRCLVDLLRACEIVGVRDDRLDRLCSRIANDSAYWLEERLAAYQARGVCSVDSVAVVNDMMNVINGEDESPQIKAAALHTLAQATGSCAIPVLSEYTHVDDELLSCAARYGYHLAGETNTAMHLLLAMVPSAKLDESIENIAKEIGEPGRKSLRETLDSKTATLPQRLLAFRTLAGMPSADWNDLLKHVSEEEEGKAFEESLRMAWNFDDSIVPALFKRIEQSPSNSPIALQAWRLVDDFTSGLGAGGDEDNGLSSAMRQAIVFSAKASDSEGVKTRPEPIGGAVATAPPPSEVWSPDKAIPAPLPPLSSVDREAGISRRVDVFYGTNRAIKLISQFGHRMRWGLFAVAVLCLAICMFAFAWQRATRFALTALIGLAGVVFLAQDTLDGSAWFLESPTLYSGDYADEVKFGVCQVTIPETHVPGQLESPSLFLRFEVKSDPSKHIVLAKTEQLERDEFFKKLHANMDQTGKNLLVFIHGYNVSFEDAARRTAQMAVDLQFQGAPVFYSWPSHNDWYRYPDDALNIQASVGQIRAFLEQLARDSGAEAIHLVAHSMGNVGLTQALAKLEGEGPMFHQVILAAPDIDAGVFKEQIAPRITSKAKRVTLYTSQTDLALLASRYFNQGHRVGDSSQGVVVFPGIETIDATSIDSSLLGHSYYGSSVNVLEDIANLLKDLPITNRNYLEMQPNQTPPYWSFAPRYRMANRP
ncbi:alpha/beta hydrolase [Pirellulaceae bacterium SH501]